MPTFAIKPLGLKDSSKPKRTYLFTPAVIVLACMAVAAVLSAVWFSGQSLRLDEAQSLWQSSHSPSRILNIIAQDVHVPLYALILHFWQFFFGNSVAMARLLSFGFFIASIPLVYVLGKNAFNRRVGLTVVVLFALSPFLNWYANEIRMYSLFLLLVVANQYCFVKIWKHINPDHSSVYWTGFAATAIVGTYVHYFFGMLLLAQAIFFLTHRQLFPKHTLRNFILTALLLILCLAPWLNYVFTLGAASNTKPLLPTPTTINIFNTFSQFLFGFQDDHINTLLLALWPLSVVMGFLAVRRHRHLPPEANYFLLSALLPILLAFAVSIAFRPVFLARYLILSVPSLYLFLSWFFSQYPPRLSALFTGVFISAMAVLLIVQAKSSQTPVKENYREVSAYLHQNATAEDVVIISAPFTIYPIEYYYTGPASLTTLPVWDRYAVGAIPEFREERLASQVDSAASGHRYAYVVLSYNQGYEEKIKYFFDTHYAKRTEKNFSPGLNVYVYELNAPSGVSGIFSSFLSSGGRTRPEQR